MPKKYDVVAITGTYQKDGQDKPKYKNVGMIAEKNGKFYLKLDHMVTLHDDGHVIHWFQLYEPKQKQATQQSAPQNETKPDADFDDDIPF